MKILIAVALLIVIVGLVVLSGRARRAESLGSAELHRTYVLPYVQAISARDYANAYALLARSYRQEVSLERFTAVHEERWLKQGALRSAELRRDEVSRNLFEKGRQVRLFCELAYERGHDYGWIILDETETGQFVIEGTYRESAGETLDFVVW